jgi:hypothetical protein
MDLISAILCILIKRYKTGSCSFFSIMYVAMPSLKIGLLTLLGYSEQSDPLSSPRMCFSSELSSKRRLPSVASLLLVKGLSLLILLS